MAKVGAHLTAGMGTMIPNLAKDFMLVIDTPGLLDGWKLPYVDETIDCKLQKLIITDDNKHIAQQWLIDFLKGICTKIILEGVMEPLHGFAMTT